MVIKMRDNKYPYFQKISYGAVHKLQVKLMVPIKKMGKD